MTAASPRESAIYRGRLAHTRMAPKRHQFDYPVYMVYIDLAELPEPFGRTRLFSVDRPAPARFKRRDYLGDADVPLEDSVREVVREQTGDSINGPIRLLTNLRTFGYIFNPITVYYCFDETGELLTHAVADVSNIPYGERHAYVFKAAADGSVAGGEAEKQMYVSPFLSMDYTYRFRAPLPGEQLRLSIANVRDGVTEFAAKLHMHRRPATAAQLRRALMRHPAMAASITSKIFWQAAKLRAKGIRVQERPGDEPGHETDTAKKETKDVTRVR